MAKWPWRLLANDRRFSINGRPALMAYRYFRVSGTSGSMNESFPATLAQKSVGRKSDPMKRNVFRLGAVVVRSDISAKASKVSDSIRSATLSIVSIYPQLDAAATTQFQRMSRCFEHPFSFR